MANVDPGTPPQNQDVGAPIQGLFLDRPAWKIPPGGFSACNNVRIEFGRVRADLLGWSASDQPATIGKPIVYSTSFVSSFNGETPIFATTTDLLIAAAGAWQYITPTYTFGTVSVSNGGQTVTGDGRCRWAQDIGEQATVTAVGTFAAGATTIEVSAATNMIYNGLVIADAENAEAIPPGTYTVFNYVNTSGKYFIELSQALTATISNGDTINIGQGASLRPIVRAGDQISFGSNQQNSPSATWYTVESVASNNSLTLTAPYVGSNLSGAEYTVREVLTDLTAATPPALPECSSTNFPAAGGYASGDQWYFTNGIDPLIVWNPTFAGNANNVVAGGAFFVRTSPNQTCNAVEQKQGLLILGGLTQGGTLYGTSIASSDNGFPMQFAGGVSFQGIASDGPFIITRLGILGSTLMIYQSGKWGGGPDGSDDESGAVTTASFVGYPTIWAFSDVIKTRGPLAGGLVAEFPDRHQFLSIDGEYRYNGLFIQVMNDQVWRSVMKSFDATRPWAAYCMIVPTYGDLIWAIPLTTDPAGQLYSKTAYVEAYMEQANSYLFKPITQRDFPFLSSAAINVPIQPTWNSWAGNQWNLINAPWNSFGYGAAAPTYLACDYLGNVWNLYQSNTQAGTPALCTVTWGSKVIGNARSRALVKRVYPEIEYIASPPSDITVTLTLADALGGPTVITDTQTFNPSYSNSDIFFTTHYRRGRLATVTVSDDAGLGWVADGWDMDWVPGGLR
jgi:hypothetical protein